jgi:uncharacterized protein (TIGR02246 family)
MATDAVAVVARMVDAYNARDIDRFLDCYSPDAVVEDGSSKVLRQGHHAMREFYGQLFAQSPQLRCVVRQRIHVGRYVIDEEAISGIHLDGFPTEVHAAAVYLVEKDLIARVRILT